MGGIVLPMLFLGPDEKQMVGDKAFYGMDIHSFEDGWAQQLAGSAYWIDNELFIKVVETILINLGRAGFKIVVAHGHGPSTEMLRVNTKRLEKTAGIRLANLWRRIEKDAFGFQIDHAAQNETSLIMALRPELEHLEEIAGSRIPIGIMGKDPRKSASIQLGEKIITKNMERMESVLKKILAREQRSILPGSYRNARNLTVSRNIEMVIRKIEKKTGKRKIKL